MTLIARRPSHRMVDFVEMLRSECRGYALISQLLDRMHSGCSRRDYKMFHVGFRT